TVESLHDCVADVSGRVRSRRSALPCPGAVWREDQILETLKPVLSGFLTKKRPPWVFPRRPFFENRDRLSASCSRVSRSRSWFGPCGARWPCRRAQSPASRAPAASQGSFRPAPVDEAGVP